MFESHHLNGDRLPTVSCIIIFLNEERFLIEAINSVLAQTYTDWELLLVDDGSYDRSPSIARNYAAVHAGRIQYLTHEGHANLGMSASRNLGLQHARGRLIAFLDGDDVWLTEKLAQQVALFERYPEAGMVCGATEYWYSWDPENGSHQDEVVVPGDIPGGVAIKQDALIAPPKLAKKLYPLGRGASPSTSGFMISRQLVTAVGSFENIFTGIYEDQVFKIKAYLHAPIYISSLCFDRYRQHSESCVHLAHASGSHTEGRRVFLRWMEAYLDQVGCRDPVIQVRLRRVLLRFDYPGIHRIWRKLKRLVLGSS